MVDKKASTKKVVKEEIKEEINSSNKEEAKKLIDDFLNGKRKLTNIDLKFIQEVL